MTNTNNTAALQFTANQSHMIEWLSDCNGDVDATAFSDECDRIAHLVASRRGVRVPLGIIGRGVIALDFAAGLVHEFVSPLITNANVPGAKEFNRLATGN